MRGRQEDARICEREIGEGEIAYLDRSLKLEQDGLRDEDLAGLGAQITNLGFQQLNLLAGPAAPHLQEAVDYRVEVDVVLIRHCKVLTSPKDGAHRLRKLGSDRQISTSQM